MAVETIKRLWKNEYFQTIFTVVLMFLVVLGLYFGAQAVLGTPYPALAVASGSMLPTLNIGDLIIVQKIDPAQINASKFYGDILVFRNPRQPNDLIVHRAVKIQQAGNYFMITTVGDASDVDKDQFSPWNSSLLIGRVVARIPCIGNIPLLLHSERNMYILLLMFMAILIILMLPFNSNKREKLANKAEKYVEKRELFEIDLSHIFYILLNVVLIGLIIFSLWGSYTFWQPGATPPSATIRGMYADLRYHEDIPNVDAAYLSQGFLTYRIDCKTSKGVRMGVPTFAWYQFFVLVLISFNVWKVYGFWKIWRTGKHTEQAIGKD